MKKEAKQDALKAVHQTSRAGRHPKITQGQTELLDYESSVSPVKLDPTMRDFLTVTSVPHSQSE